MKNKLNELKERANGLIVSMRGILDKASKEERSLNADESAKYEAMETEFDRASGEIKRLERLIANEEFMSVVPENQLQSKSEVSADDNFWAYVRGAEFVRGLSTTDANGGYTVPKTFQNSVIELLNKEVLLRKLCSVMTTANTNYIAVEASRPNFSWLEENAAYQEANLTFSQIQLGAHKAGGIIKISEELLNDSGIDIQSYVKSKMVDGLKTLEEAAFLNGSGANQPTGLLNGVNVGVTTAATGKFSADEVIDAFYSLNVGYRKNAVWLVSDSFEKELRKLKDTNGNYLWQPALTADAPNMLLNRPIYVSEYMENALTTGKIPAIFGDLKYYQIADRGAMGLQRLNELYAGNGQVGFRIYKRTEGKLTMSDAIKAIKMK